MALLFGYTSGQLLIQLIYFFPPKGHKGLSTWNLVGKTLENKMTLAGYEQQVGNHRTKEWFYCWNLITFIDTRDLRGLFNLILLPRRLTYSWCVRNAIFQMTSSPVTKSGYGSLQSAGSSPCSSVWDTYLIFPLYAGFFHSSFFNFKYPTVGRLILLYWVPFLFQYLCSHCDIVIHPTWLEEGIW